MYDCLNTLYCLSFQTENGHLIIYHLALPVDVKTLYELQDPPGERFINKNVKPLNVMESSLNGAHSLMVKGFCDMTGST